MNDPIKFFSEKRGEIQLSPALPSLSDPGYLSGVKSMGANGTFGYLLLQEIMGNGYLIRYHSYYLNQDDTFTVTFPEPCIRLCVGLKNTFYYKTLDLGEDVLHERGFYISYTPALQQMLRLRAKQPYAYIGIHFSIGLIQKLSEYFPGVEDFLQKIQLQQPALLNLINQVANKEMLNVVEDILYCPYPSEARKRYLDNKVVELLIQALEKIIFHPVTKAVNLPEKVVENIYKARELLLKNIKHTYTLNELASLSDLTIYQLKKGFMAIYALSVTDFLHEARMQKARLLLEETDLPICQIAGDTGYNHPFAFSSAFKKYFGYAPSLIQKSRKKAAGGQYD